ncbi:MAG: cytidine deaminase [Spartobacteria bacterium]
MGAQVEWEQLAARARAARDNAYAPYSNFRVGAALLLRNGEVAIGCNVENASFGLTICAERAAVTAALGKGCRDFLGLAIVTNAPTPTSPCGACRQVLAEFNPSLPIYSETISGKAEVWSLEILLPAGFSKPDL